MTIRGIKETPQRLSCTYAEAISLLHIYFGNTSLQRQHGVATALSIIFARDPAVVISDLTRGSVFDATN